MTRTEMKRAAQDKIMQRLADTLLIAAEEGENEFFILEMQKNMKRIGRLFGYTSWPGIGNFGR